MTRRGQGREGLAELEEAALEGAAQLLEEPLRAVERFERSAWEDLKAFTLWGERALVAGRVTLAIIAAVLIAHALGLAMPVWAAISVLRVFQNDKNATLRRGLERIAGTVLGGLISYAIMLDGKNAALVWVATGLASALAVYAQAITRYSYAFILVGFTVPLMTYHAMASSDPILDTILMRGAEVCLGVTIATLVDYVTSRRQSAKKKLKPLIGPVDPAFIGHALTVGIAVTLVPLIWTVFHLPGFDQTPITAFIVVSAAREGIGWKSLNRIIGCGIGAVFGLTGVALVGDAGYVPWLAFLTLGLFLFTQVCHGGSLVSYTGVQAGICFLLIFVQEPIPHLDPAEGYARLWGVVGGIILVMLVGLATWPVRQRITRAVEEHRLAHEKAE
ncbi:MAG: FUSC family protein [Pseudomonadota bacterium]